MSVEAKPVAKAEEESAPDTDYYGEVDVGPICKEEEVPTSKTEKEETLAVEIKIESNSDYDQLSDDEEVEEPAKSDEHSCTKCDFVGQTRASLGGHMYQSHNSKPFKCQQGCDFEAATYHHYYKHKKTSHCEGYKCKECGMKFSRNGTLRRHVQTVHEGATKFSCSKCDFKSNRKDLLDRHAAKVHDERPEEFKCSGCDFSAASLYKLNRHETEAHTPSFVCSECGQGLPTESQLNEHLRRVHEGVRFSCPNCDFTADRMSTITCHVRRFHSDGSAKFKCDQCYRTFAEKSYLGVHKRRIHEKPHVCTHCDYKAGRPIQMKTHLKNVHGIA